MPWPTQLTAISVHIKIVAANSSQTPAAGEVLFRMPYPLKDPADNVIVGRQTLVATLDAAGEATIQLPATNDPDISPQNWAYTCTVNTDVWRDVFALEIPYNMGALEFSDLAPAVTPPAVQTFALLGHTHPGAAGAAFRGEWQSGTEYEPGDTVTYGDGYYGTPAGAIADDAPWTLRTLYTGTPATTEAADTGDYQFRALCTTAKRVRVEDIGYYKAATQVAVPHELRVYDVGASTATPLAVVSVPGEVAGASGFQFAPIIGDILPGRSYGFTVVAGAGADAGYVYTAAFGFPLAVGSVTMSAGGFSGSHANITTITNPTTYYGGVTPRWQEPSVSWVLLGRFDPVVIGSARSFNYPIVPV